MTVSIARICLDRLRAEAAASPEREICGLLFGTPVRIEAALATLNIAARIEDEFEIDPRALIAAHRAERAGGPRLIGHYHSHPSGSAFPSARDAAAAEPGRLWLILASGDARLWRSEIDGFAAVPLDIG
ncbi:M67 family metallopeptidase [Sphingomonas sp. AP4-R1]|uniref:M67 family metallopeptidase n=1 Tax=Sphingomonas sp. AP4-R1 TaxID=2735134 RepID=UPI0015972638|nr:M67 family metallopeptidase [Sphingomonas sp. AP4-R1]QJU60820.1 M67 family metallopeptidase [Sphingomonas sp. AP4-R1]